MRHEEITYIFDALKNVYHRVLIVEQDIIHSDTQMKAKKHNCKFFYRQIKPKRLSHTVFTIEKIMYFLGLYKNDVGQVIPFWQASHAIQEVPLSSENGRVAILAHISSISISVS